MSTGNKTSAKTPIGKAYWVCQVAGWSALLLFQTSLVVLVGSVRNPPPELANSSRLSVFFSLAVLAASGFLVSHLFYLVMRRRWLHIPLAKAWPRLVAGVAVAAAAQHAINVLVSLCTGHHTRLEDEFRLAAMFISWLVYVFLFSIWLTIYLAVHEFRRRRAAEVHALRLELVVQEAQLRGLRAQLNPHFLFNCLNGLREMIVEDPRRAQTMVMQLSGLLRYSLESDAEQVFLEDEIQAVKDYLALEAIRFEERLRVRWDIAPESNKVRVPPMLLQTLVENALKHGISRRPEGGEISIRAQVRDSHLQLEVLNSGEPSDQPSENGTGLKNARSRLQLLYGDQAKIVLEKAPGGNARAVGTIPLQPKEAASASVAGGR
jgi:hypothetical protein